MKIVKALVMIGTGLLLMGNESCEKQGAIEAPKPRTLKKIVDVGLVSSRLIDMPDGQKFDFQYVINQQIYPVLQASEGFWFRYRPPFDVPPAQIGSQIRFSDMNLETQDIAMLERNFSTHAVINTAMFEDISCLINLPQYHIWGTINSFELKNKKGLRLGFANGAGLSPIGIPGINFGVDTYQLDLNMVAAHPLTMESVAATNVTGKQTQTTLEFNLPLSNLLVNPGFYFQTPLARVSYNALEKAVRQIQEQLDKKQEANPWFTRVLLSGEHRVVILAGGNHNVKVGDVFDIHNEKVYWSSSKGAPIPCESTYQGYSDGDRVASIEIIEISDSTSVGRIVYESGAPIRMGSKVKIQKLLEPTVSKDSSAAKVK